jgi:uncharacterized membrane protein
LAEQSARAQIKPEARVGVVDAAGMDQKVRRVELAISYLLRGGVLLSVALVAAGLGVSFSQRPGFATLTGPTSYRQALPPAYGFPHSLGQLASALGRGDGRGLIGLGLIILIATPVLRVAVGMLGFAYEKDPPMTIVTLFVLCVLIGSFFLGGA